VAEPTVTAGQADYAVVADNRRVIGDMEFVCVPAGKFIMGKSLR
jgi:hypothetical protein